MQLSAKQYIFLALLRDPQIIELAIGGSGGGSKTFCMALGLLLLCKQYPGSVHFLGRKTLRSLRQTSISTLINKVQPLLGLTSDDFHLSWQNAEIEYVNGSKIIFGALDYLPSDPDFQRLGSLEIDTAFIDEAGEITLQAKNAIKSRVGRGVMAQKYDIPGKVVSSTNPSLNFMRQEYYDPYEALGGGDYKKWKIGDITIDKKERDAYRCFLRLSVFDNPFIPHSYIDTLRTLPDRERKRLLDGNWNFADEDNTLFKQSLIDKAIAFKLPEYSSDEFDKVIGVDVSDKGTDATIFTLLDHGTLITQKKSSVQLNWDSKSELPISRLIADELVEFAQRNGFTPENARRIAIECNGVGVGVRDMLKERGWQITEYTATHKTRSEGYYSLMLDMDSGEVKIMNDLLTMMDLRKELAAHTYDMDNQTPSVVKKDKIKQLIGHSPDEADSFMIANMVRRLVHSDTMKPKHFIYW